MATFRKEIVVREAAVNCLRSMGPDAKAAIPALTEASKDEDQVFSSMAKEALKRTGPDAAAE